MPLDPEYISPEVIQFDRNLSDAEIERLVRKRRLQVLQCSSPVEPDTWTRLNERFFSRRPKVALRVYGFDRDTCDLTFAARMTNVRHFSADCLVRAIGVESVCRLEHLESLGIGIYGLSDFSFLREVAKGLRSLSLEQTKSKKPDLAPLSRFENLQEVYLEGQRKNIEVLSGLVELAEVTLRSITTPDIAYLRPLTQMWSLDIKLGGIRNLNAIAGMNGIKYLELWQILGLQDIGVISTLEGLQYLFLQSLPHITALPPLGRLRKLRRLYLENMRGLRDLSALRDTPALEEFLHVSALGLQPEDYTLLFRNPSVKRADVGFGSLKKNERFEQLMKDHGIQPYSHTPFAFM
jgi:hypothetical protein